MDIDIDPCLEAPRSFSARRPLLGLTVLMVEDSRFCSETVRQMCLKSGARLRRADSLAAARRHLATYRPSVVLVDLGLPDGSGLEMIEELAAMKPAAPAILATSGQDDGSQHLTALAAGADGFIAKPLKNMKSFQDKVLDLFPEREIRTARNVVQLMPNIAPDPLAKAEDLRHAVHLLEEVVDAKDEDIMTYCAQFLASVAGTDGDIDLAALAATLGGGGPVARRLAFVMPELQTRLTASPAV